MNAIAGATASAQLSELYQELVPAEEAAIIDSFVRHDGGQHRADYPTQVRPARRRLHVKSHGCLHAEFTVLEGVPDELRHGLFANAGKYDAIVRFSNGLRRAQADCQPDARGMAIKLFGVPGSKVLEDEADATTQDFVLLNHPVFFAADAADFSGFSRAVDEHGSPLSHLFGCNPFEWKLRQAWILFRSTRPIKSPVAVRYFSQAPQRCGPLAVKLAVTPRFERTPVVPDLRHPDYLHQTLVAELQRGPVHFDFSVQVQTDARRMPIENALIEWSEQLAPFRRVATVFIPSQVFATPERERYCEDLSFTSWHTLPEHRPLGGINRMRRAAYRASSELRHQLNQAPRVEPSDFEAFLKTQG